MSIYNQKRAWCSLRDYLKSQEFSAYFKNALIQYRIQENTINKVFSEKSYSQLELPGDVWNNNSKFRNCILSNTEFITGSMFQGKGVLPALVSPAIPPPPI